jgi:hypothetical protein
MAALQYRNPRALQSPDRSPAVIREGLTKYIRRIQQLRKVRGHVRKQLHHNRLGPRDVGKSQLERIVAHDVRSRSSFTRVHRALWAAAILARADAESFLVPVHFNDPRSALRNSRSAIHCG